MITSLLLRATVAACLAIGSVQAQDWVQWDPSVGGNGHWYKAVVNTNGLTWTQVAQVAIGEGGYLATITSAAENEFVFSLVNSPEFFEGNGGNGSGPALGGYQLEGAEEPAGGWGWLTGETWGGYTNWYGGLPDDGMGFGENRLQFFSGTQSVAAPLWNDLPADASNLGGYIIERDKEATSSRSGFYGQSFIGPGAPLTPVPTRSVVSVYDSQDKLVLRVNSNPAGQFFSYLAPGDYTLVATPPRADLPPRDLTKFDLQQHPEARVVKVTVIPHQLVSAQINF